MQPSETIQVGINRWLGKQIGMILLGVTALFLSAGTLKWPMGWVQVGLLVIALLIQVGLLLPRNPELFVERSKLQPGTKKWDILLTILGAVILPFAVWIVAGFDFRHHWSQGIPQNWMLYGGTIWLFGYCLILWAMAVNTFFSATVRIQSERSQQVVSSGPYAFIRHPGYAGMLIYLLITPLMLGSWWAFIPAGLGAAIIILRTALEDRMLQHELPGYADYASRVRFRLFPGIW